MQIGNPDAFSDVAVTRRRFFQSTVLSAVAGACHTTWALPRMLMSPGDQGTGFDSALVEVVEWIKSAAVDGEGGKYWLVEPQHPGRSVSRLQQENLYSGSAGIVLFFLQLAKITGDPRYLQDAFDGASLLAQNWNAMGQAQRLAIEDSSFYTGLSGIAYALMQASTMMGYQDFKSAAFDMTAQIAARHEVQSRRAQWSYKPGISGDGGIVLFLLEAARVADEMQFKDVAVNTGYRYLEQEQASRLSGLEIAKQSSRVGFSSISKDSSFQFGAAGTAFSLLRLFEATAQVDFLTQTRRDAERVQTMSIRDADDSDDQNGRPWIYYSGLCEGEAGASRLLFALQRNSVDPDAAYLGQLRSFAQRFAVAPDSISIPSHGNYYCQCCDRAGLVDYFLGLWDATSERTYLEVANHLGRKMVDQWRATLRGDRWNQFSAQVPPPLFVAESGFSLGAAGVGTALLNLIAANKGSSSRLYLPDNPFLKISTSI